MVRRFFQRVKLLGVMTLHNGMILSTLSISSHGFTFDFLKMPRTNGDVSLTYKPMTISLISQGGTASQQSSIQTSNVACIYFEGQAI